MDDVSEIKLAACLLATQLSRGAVNTQDMRGYTETAFWGNN